MRGFELRREAERDAEMMPISEGEMVLSFMRSLATALGERNLVTPPNLASIMLLADEGGKRLLLTGDGHSADIVKGLRLHGLLDGQGRLHVDVLKVQHHGAEFNIEHEREGGQEELEFQLKWRRAARPTRRAKK